MNPDIPLPHCARCGSTLLLCTCSGVPWGQDVVYPVEPRLPEDATPQQRMERWALHVSLNPAACAFQGAQFVRDMQQQKGIVEAFARWAPCRCSSCVCRLGGGSALGLARPPACPGPQPSPRPAGCARASRLWPRHTATTLTAWWWRGGS